MTHSFPTRRSSDLVAWWTIYYFVKQDSIWANTWFTAALISLVISMISVPLLFYFYTQAFGIESVIVDVLLLLISLSIGQLVGLVFYKNGEGIPSSWSVLIMVFIVAMCALATICPPHLPLFYDEMGGLYGMK